MRAALPPLGAWPAQGAGAAGELTSLGQVAPPASLREPHLFSLCLPHSFALMSSKDLCGEAHGKEKTLA